MMMIFLVIGESFSGVSELDDSDNDKTYTPTNTILHVSASSSDPNDEEHYHRGSAAFAAHRVMPPTMITLN